MADELAAAGRPLVGLRRVRFVAVVRPGEDVRVDWAPHEAGISFTVSGDGRVRVRGIGLLGPP